MFGGTSNALALCELAPSTTISKSQPSHRILAKHAENMGFLVVFDPVGWNEPVFWLALFTIVNEINGFSHISYGMAV